MLIKELRINRGFANYYKSSIPEHEDPETAEADPIINKKVLKTSELLRRVNKSFGPKHQNIILPRNCRYIKKLSNSYTMYIIEQDPELRTIIASFDVSGPLTKLKVQEKLHEFGYENWKHGKRKNKFLLAFPFVEYIIILNSDNYLNNIMIFLRHLPLQGIGDILYKIPLYNIPGNQRICMGGGNIYQGSDINEAIQHTISRFWSSTFNEDYISNVAAYADNPYVGDLLSWQHYSKVDPMFVYNVNWIPYKRNLNQIVEEEASKFDGAKTNYGVANFDQIVNLFSKSEDTKIEQDRKKIFDNIANYIRLEQDINLFTEDSIIIRNKRFFVLSFLGDIGTGNVSHIKLINPNGKEIIFKLTVKSRKFLLEKIKEQRHVLVTSVNGQEIRPGDILEIEDKEGIKSYKRLDYMRYSFDGKVEAKMGSDFYIIENIKRVRQLDLNKPEINGIKLTPRRNYLSAEERIRSYDGVPFYNAKSCKFREMDVTSTGNLRAKFIDLQTNNRFSINYTTNLENKLYLNSKLKPLPRVFRSGTRLYNIWNDYERKVGEGVGFSHPEDGIIVYSGYSLHKPDFQNSISNILINNNQTLRVAGFDLDLEFSIGDTVIAVDWRSPQEMIIPKTIVDFNVNESMEELYVVLERQNSDKDKYDHLFIDYDRGAFIKVGTLRHIESNYGEISAGTMIRSNRPRLPNFPQKDINMIVGFITDTGRDIPMILCSNCCTIWADQLEEDFDIIPADDRRLNGDRFQPPRVDVSNIKFQPGDIVAYDGFRDDPLILYSNTHDRGIKYQRTSTYGKLMDEFTFNLQMRRRCSPFGLLTPRHQQVRWMEFNKLTAYPNFHGMFTINRQSGFTFDLDERRHL